MLMQILVDIYRCAKFKQHILMLKRKRNKWLIDYNLKIIIFVSVQSRKKSVKDKKVN